VITSAALCPWPPLLVRELTGADPVLPELRAACAEAVATLLRDGPEVVAVVGPGTATASWPGDGRLNIAAFGPGATAPDRAPAPWTAERPVLPPAPGAAEQPGLPPAPGTAERPGLSPAPGTTEPPVLPPAPGIGAYLLDQAGYHGQRLIWSVSADEPVAGCRKLGADLAGGSTRTALLIIGDGSARRGPRAPGHFDERAAAFDAEMERAMRAGDLTALLDLDPALARELMATGRPAWQVLAGALEGMAGLAVEVQYAGDPFGVAYLVATLGPAVSRGSAAQG
jgi:hypothetical protein